MPENINLFDRMSKQEKILLTHGFQNFNIGTVQRTYGDRPIHHEFHVARAGSFFTCG